MKGLALVVIVERFSACDATTGGFYLAEDTCLNQLARLARFLDTELMIVIFFEHSEWRWTGRGMRETRSSGT